MYNTNHKPKKVTIECDNEGYIKKVTVITDVNGSGDIRNLNADTKPCSGFYWIHPKQLINESVISNTMNYGWES